LIGEGPGDVDGRCRLPVLFGDFVGRQFRGVRAEIPDQVPVLRRDPLPGAIGVPAVGQRASLPVVQKVVEHVVRARLIG